MALFEFKEVPRISVLSTTYVKCLISATESGLAANPTTGVLSFAFVADEVLPVTGDWKSGSWETAGTEYWARCLVGTGGTVALPVGTYDAWVRVVKGVETVVVKVGKLTVY